jgi:uncharacterized protein YwbE
MHKQSIETKEDYDWYKLRSTILGVREKQSGGFTIKAHMLGDLLEFKNLLDKIIDFYKYQYIIFDTRSLNINQKKLTKELYEQELRRIGFGIYQTNNFAFQEKPKVGDTVIVAIKPYIGRYDMGKIEQILTGAKYHPRGYKVMLNDKEGTVGRIATIRKKNHKNAF